MSDEGLGEMFAGRCSCESPCVAEMEHGIGCCCCGEAFEGVTEGERAIVLAADEAYQSYQTYLKNSAFIRTSDAELKARYAKNLKEGW